MVDELERAGFDGAAFTAAQLVSELVTNVVLHARTELTVTIDARGHFVRVGVEDFGPAMPRRRLHRLDSGTGRGLLLVDHMARAWGVEQTGGGRRGGKVVWFELSAEADGVSGDLLESNGY